MVNPLELPSLRNITVRNRIVFCRCHYFYNIFPGVDAELELCRIGKSSTLAYEFRGPWDVGPQVYELICEASKEYDIKRLGWKTYTVNHMEGDSQRKL